MLWSCEARRRQLRLDLLLAARQQAADLLQRGVAVGAQRDRHGDVHVDDDGAPPKLADVHAHVRSSGDGARRRSQRSAVLRYEGGSRSGGSDRVEVECAQPRRAGHGLHAHRQAAASGDGRVALLRPRGEELTHEVQRGVANGARCNSHADARLKVDAAGAQAVVRQDALVLVAEAGRGGERRGSRSKIMLLAYTYLLRSHVLRRARARCGAVTRPLGGWGAKAAPRSQPRG